MVNKEICVEEQSVVDAWKLCKKVLTHDILYSAELYNVLKNFLKYRFTRQSFSFLDLGCGDAAMVSNALKHSTIGSYVGVDTSSVALSYAAEHLRFIKHKKLLQQDLLGVVSDMMQPVDVIFSGFSLHYLSQGQKATLLKNAYQCVKPGGYFVIMDVHKQSDKSQRRWVKEIYALLRSRLNLAKHEREDLFLHLKSMDFSREGNTYAHMAKEAGWDEFSALVEKPFVSFLVLTKKT